MEEELAVDYLVGAKCAARWARAYVPMCARACLRMSVGISRA